MLSYAPRKNHSSWKVKATLSKSSGNVYGSKWKPRENKSTKTFVDQLDIVTPRDAFCGGWTNAVKLYHHGEEGEEIDLPLRILEQELRISLKTSCDNFSARSHWHLTLTLAWPNVLYYHPTSSTIQCCLSDRTTSSPSRFAQAAWKKWLNWC